MADKDEFAQGSWVRVLRLPDDYSERLEKARLELERARAQSPRHSVEAKWPAEALQRLLVMPDALGNRYKVHFRGYNYVCIHVEGVVPEFPVDCIESEAF